jgi:hypothetical protein
MNPTQEIAEIRAILREVAENQKKTEAQMKRTDRKLESLISNWGQLVESLSEVGLIEELARYGVTGLRESLHNLEIKDAQNQIIKEFDRILIDSDVLVIVEAKSTLRTQDVDKHLDDIQHIFESRLSKGMDKIYSALVFLNAHDQTVTYAERKGLFIIKISGDGMLKGKNSAGFVPANFARIAS